MKINSVNHYRTPWQRTGQKTQMRSGEKCRLVTYRTLAHFFCGSHATPASRRSTTAALVYIRQRCHAIAV